MENIILYDNTNNKEDTSLNELIKVLRDISYDNNGNSKVSICGSSKIVIGKIGNNILINNEEI